MQPKGVTAAKKQKKNKMIISMVRQNGGQCKKGQVLSGVGLVARAIGACSPEKNKEKGTGRKSGT
jgi:hypothetical protein